MSAASLPRYALEHDRQIGSGVGPSPRIRAPRRTSPSGRSQESDSRCGSGSCLQQAYPDTLWNMIVERSMSDQWLSNTYVVADELGGHAVMIDAGGPVAPLLEFL